MSKKYITDNIKIDGQLLDGSGSAGTSGQILSSTGTATDWINLSDISGVDGSGSAERLAVWSDSDTISYHDNLRWDGEKLMVESGNSSTSSKTVSITHTRNDSNVSTQAITIDANFSGADTTTADRTNAGLYIDLDSSADGDASNEVRSYGVWVDARITGYNDLLRGGYFFVESNNTTEKTAEIAGVYGLATHDSSSTNGGVSNMYGVRGVTAIQDYGDVDNTYAVHGLVQIADNRNANVDNTHALYGEIQIDEATALSYGSMYGCRVVIDNNEGSVPTFSDQYLFYGAYQGTTATGAYGIYVQGDRHYLAGSVGIGENNPVRDLQIKKSTSGGQVRAEVFNTSNTANSHGVVSIYSGGSSAGDPFLHWKVDAVQDWSMGIDNSDSDKLKISKNFGPGVNDYLTIATTGNVGIGTTNPDGLLNLKHTSSSSSVANDATAYALTLNFEGATGDYGRHIAIRDASGQAVAAIGGYDEGTGGATGLFFATGNATTAAQEAMMIDSSGNVGIGATSIDAKLHIQSASATGAVINLESTHAGGIPIYNLKGAHSAQLRYQDENGNNQSRIDFTDGGSFNFIDATDGSSHMLINSSGRVGIGRTPVAAALEVEGQIRVTGTSGYTFNAGGDTDGGMFSTADGTINFRTNGSERMRIDSSGNVMIGNTSAAAKLDIRQDSGVAIRCEDGTGGYFVVNQGGDTGIGTTSPAEKLTVSGDSNITGKLAVGSSAAHPTYDFYNQNTAYFNGAVTVDDTITVNNLTYPEPGAIDASGYNGEIVYFGSQISMSEGKLMVLSVSAAGATWYLAKDSTNSLATGMLGIALGTTASAGLLVRGIAKNSAWSSFSEGEKLYLSPTSGAISNSITSDTNDFVRIIGYALGSNKIYFCPDNSYVQNS
jgi:hypothetical protein